MSSEEKKKVEEQSLFASREESPSLIWAIIVLLSAIAFIMILEVLL